VLYQLSYAPRLREGLYRRRPGITSGVQTPENDNPETPRQAENDLLQEQERKGYGDDEGEREQALDSDDEQ
jgi:predicted DNA-binding WGR domain protein